MAFLARCVGFYPINFRCPAAIRAPPPRQNQRPLLPPKKCKPPAVLRSLPPAALRGGYVTPQAPAVLCMAPPAAPPPAVLCPVAPLCMAPLCTPVYPRHRLPHLVAICQAYQRRTPLSICFFLSAPWRGVGEAPHKANRGWWLGSYRAAPPFAGRINLQLSSG
jgi:hypothetical protein